MKRSISKILVTFLIVSILVNSNISILYAADTESYDCSSDVENERDFNLADIDEDRFGENREAFSEETAVNDSFDIASYEEEVFQVEYVVVDRSEIVCEEDSIIVGYYGVTPNDAILQLINNENGEVLELTATKIIDDAILFCADIHIDNYNPYKLIYNYSGFEYENVLSDYEFDYETPDAYIVEESDELETASTTYNYYNGNLVIVLDPGHDSDHIGTSGNGVREEDVNFKIASYCKQELETYYGVSIYMTRNSVECPYKGTSSKEDNTNRVNFAKSVGANAYVSFHCNSSENSSVKGAEIYYPNSNYNSNISQVGKDLATEILKNLAGLGLKDRGIKINNSGDGTTYPDGSVADKYLVIKNSKIEGIPAVLIEHAFVSNPDDASFLGNENNLRNMGVADAKGIANYFGLSKTGFGINGVSFRQENDYTLVSVDSYSSIGNPTYTIEVYDYDTKQWVKIADKQSFSSVKWKPNRKKYGVHIDAITPDGTRREFYTVYESDIDYNKPYVKINDIIPVATAGGINVGANYISNDKSVVFSWLAYNTGTKQWSTIADWNGGNWATWKPNHGSYWICAKAKASDGNEVTKTIGYVVNDNYGSDYVELTGATWRINNYSIDLGTAYNNRGSSVQFKWQIYNLDIKQWSTIADWNSCNWVTWRPKPGNYWVNTQARTEKGSTDQYTYCFKVNSDKSKTPVIIDGLTWKFNRNSIDVGVAYSSENKNVKFKWQTYNLGTKKWDTVADWNGGNWATWKPKPGNYWLHVETQNGDGGYAEKTICFAVDNDYSKYYVDLDGICIIDQHAYFAIGTSYSSDDRSVKFRWKQYDISKAEWTTVADWSNSNWANWYPSNGNYWLYVEAMTSDGTVASSVLGYTVSARYEIMGASSTSVEQMVKYYNKYAQYPEFYSQTDAPNIYEFCKIYNQECKAEGVKTEIAFCQTMKETNFLKFGGDVSINQYNFAGIGATGNGNPGNSFSSVREGVRAQVQHLKAYACDSKLNQACVDPRFTYVKRGSAKYVEWLGIQENPNGTGWAASKEYGYSIIKDYAVKLLSS